MKKRSSIFKLLLPGLIIVGLLWLNSNVLHINPQAIRTWIISFGWAAPIAYVLIYTVRPLILFPASLVSLSGGLAFGPLWGTVYTIIGATMGAVLSFILARNLGKTFVRKRLNGNWERVEEQLQKRGFIYVLLLRFIPLFPFDFISYAAGLSRIKLSAFFFGTVLGILPGTFAFNFLGSSFVSGNRLYIILAAALLILVLLIPILLKNKFFSK